jgi:corrinoid protein of di/trimethylamine methyltransferase
MDLAELTQHVIEGNAPGAGTLTEKALEAGMDPLDIVQQWLVPGMDVVGEKFKNEEYYMPDMLLSARAMKTAMALIRPLLADREDASVGQVVIGTVKGDLHDIGKNLVAMMLEGAGFEVNDLGTDVSPEAFVEAVEKFQPELVCMSALLTTTMPMMETTIKSLAEAELLQTVKVMVGGAPVTEAYANRIGAHAFAQEAATAVESARALVGASAP